MKNRMDKPRAGSNLPPENPGQNPQAQTIPVIEEQLRVNKKVVEAGKVHVSKKVVEQQTSITLPLNIESYQIERVPINQVVDEAPPPVRYEGDTMIIPVLREVLVVQKKYEVMEELRLTRQVTQQQHTEPVTLLKEEVHIERSRADEKDKTL